MHIRYRIRNADISFLKYTLYLVFTDREFVIDKYKLVIISEKKR